MPKKQKSKRHQPISIDSSCSESEGHRIMPKKKKRKAAGPLSVADAMSEEAHMINKREIRREKRLDRKDQEDGRRWRAEMKQQDQQHELLMTQNMILVNQSKAMLLKLDLQHQNRSHDHFHTPPSQSSPQSDFGLED